MKKPKKYYDHEENEEEFWQYEAPVMVEKELGMITDEEKY